MMLASSYRSEYSKFIGLESEYLMGRLHIRSGGPITVIPAPSNGWDRRCSLFLLENKTRSIWIGLGWEMKSIKRFARLIFRAIKLRSISSALWVAEYEKHEGNI